MEEVGVEDVTALTLVYWQFATNIIITGRKCGAGVERKSCLQCST